MLKQQNRNLIGAGQAPLDPSTAPIHDRRELCATPDLRSRVRETVTEMIGYKVADAQPLISAGLIDSLSLLKLICTLEKNLGLVIPGESVSPDDFECVERISETIERLRNQV